jgi:hypothetical protein
LIGAHSVSIVLLGGDILPQYRFLFPCSALLAALAGAGAADWLALGSPVQRQTGTLMPWGSRLALRAAVLLCLIGWAGATTAYQYRRDKSWVEPQRRWNIRHIATGLALREADYHIARTPPRRGRLIGHNKTDVAYVLARNPAFIEMNLSSARLADVAWLARQQQIDEYGYSFDLALDPIFRERYALRMADQQGRRVPFVARNAVASSVWRVPEAFYQHLEAWAE